MAHDSVNSWKRILIIWTIAETFKNVTIYSEFLIIGTSITLILTISGLMNHTKVKYLDYQYFYSWDFDYRGTHFFGPGNPDNWGPTVSPFVSQQSWEDK